MQELLFPWGGGAPPSLYRDVSDNLEAPPNPLLRGFYLGFITEV